MPSPLASSIMEYRLAHILNNGPATLSSVADAMYPLSVGNEDAIAAIFERIAEPVLRAGEEQVYTLRADYASLVSLDRSAGGESTGGGEEGEKGVFSVEEATQKAQRSPLDFRTSSLSPPHMAVLSQTQAPPPSKPSTPPSPNVKDFNVKPSPSRSSAPSPSPLPSPRIPISHATETAATTTPSSPLSSPPSSLHSFTPSPPPAIPLTPRAFANRASPTALSPFSSPPESLHSPTPSPSPLASFSSPTRSKQPSNPGSGAGKKSATGKEKEKGKGGRKKGEKSHQVQCSGVTKKKKSRCGFRKMVALGEKTWDCGRHE